MSEESTKFSIFYSNDASLHHDKPKFRQRLLKYLEDCFNNGFPLDTYTACRKELGIDIECKPMSGAKILVSKYYFEEAVKEQSIGLILDSVTTIYEVWNTNIDNSISPKMLEKYVYEINKIFREESMAYMLTDDGAVRFYPDEEFHKNVKSTLVVLNNEKHTKSLSLFNKILEELYEKHNHESPIKSLFECIESFVLSFIRGVSNRLENGLITKLFEKTNEKIIEKGQYSKNDFEALEKIREMFLAWVQTSHKYRHGKPDQEDKIVPEEIFNCLFSTGVSIFRFLLEINNKYFELQEVSVLV